jgi:RNA polymerase sigma-70 factor (ECF subfamily)
VTLSTQDKELLEQARTYNPQALAEIYDRYADSMYRYLYRLVGDAQQAEDLTSDLFIRLLDVLNTRRAPQDQLQGWLYRVAHNLAMDWFREQGKHTSIMLNEELATSGESLLETVEQRQAQSELQEAIGQLTAGQQQVILLRFAEGLKLREVSRVMGKSEGAIKVLQHRAVKRLQALLEKEAVQTNEKPESRPVRNSPAASRPRPGGG